MKDERIFTEDIQVPEIVTKKADVAFAKIRKDSTKQMKRSKRFLKTPAVVAASVCLVVAGAMTVTAAVQHFWGNAVENELKGTQEQKEKLEDSGMATVMAGKEEYKDRAVTVDGVTITPNVVIADEHFARVSFYIDGYTLPDDESPAFGEQGVYMGDDPDTGALNWGGGFFDGLIYEGNEARYADGTPARSAVNDNGYDAFVAEYTDENGRMEYSYQLSLPDNVGSFLGQTLHFAFYDLGSYKGKMGEIHTNIKGEWKFALTLSEKNLAKTTEVNKKVEGSAFTVDTVEISPISIVVKMKADEALEAQVDENQGILNVNGVILKNGEKLEDITGATGGFSGYTDEQYRPDSGQQYLKSMENGEGKVVNPPAAISMNGFQQIVDPDEVAGIILTNEQGEEFTVEFDR